MRHSLVFAAMVLWLGVEAHAQKIPCPEIPRSKLESLAAQDGVLVVKGSSRIGEIKGLASNLIIIESMEVKALASGVKQLGVAIELMDLSKAEVRHVCTIDYEDINALLKAVDFFSTANHSLTSLDNYQATYRLPSGFQLSIRSTRSGEGVKVSSITSCGDEFSVFLSPADMPVLKDLIATAKAKLDELSK